MLFNSFEFLVLLIITFSLFYIPIFRRFQLGILVLSSFVFYAYYKPILLFLLIFSILINSFTSYKIRFGTPLRKRFYATLGIVLNLSILAFFKYSPLLARTFIGE